jgi:hypothetical protein
MRAASAALTARGAERPEDLDRRDRRQRELGIDIIGHGSEPQDAELDHAAGVTKLVPPSGNSASRERPGSG